MTRTLEKPFLSIREAAKFFGLSPDMLYERRKMGGVPGVHYGAKFYVNIPLFAEMLDCESVAEISDKVGDRSFKEYRPKPETLFMCVAKAAAFFGLSKGMLYTRQKENKLPHILNGSKFLVNISELWRLLDAESMEAVAE